MYHHYGFKRSNSAMPKSEGAAAIGIDTNQESSTTYKLLLGLHVIDVRISIVKILALYSVKEKKSIAF